MALKAYLATLNGNGTSSITRSAPSAVATAAAVTTSNRLSISFANQPGDGQTLTFGTSSASVTFEFDSASTASGGGTAVTIGGSTSATRLAFQNSLSASSISGQFTLSSTSATVVRVSYADSVTIQVTHLTVSTSANGIPTIAYSSSQTDGTVNILDSNGIYLAINDAVVVDKLHLHNLLNRIRRLLSRDMGRVSEVSSLATTGTATE